MADFLAALSDDVGRRRAQLLARLGADDGDGLGQVLGALVARHWHPLPAPSARRRPATAVDGSIRRMGLSDGAELVVVQALALGDDGVAVPRVAVELLPPSVPRATAARFADLLLQRAELELAGAVADEAPPGATLLLDGALYGRLPQLYPLPMPEEFDALARLPDAIIAAYARLVETARRRELLLVALSKTSREAAHAALWLAADGIPTPLPDGVTDGALIARRTGGAAGVSTPVRLGSRGFTGGSEDLLRRPEIGGGPAIASCFVRLSELDDPLRLDAPAFLCGDPTPLAAIDGDLLPGGPAAMAEVVAAVLADHGGPEVYHSLLYAVDREVRLRRDTAVGVYLPLVSRLLGVELRLDRSERRF